MGFYERQSLAHSDLATETGTRIRKAFQLPYSFEERLHVALVRIHQ